MKSLYTYLLVALLVLMFVGTGQVVAQTTAGTVIVNTGRLHFNYLDGRTADSLTSNAAAVTVTARNVLSLQKLAVPGAVAPFDTLTFKVIVTDTGLSTAHGVVVSDTVPASFTVLSVSKGTFTGQVVRWNIGTMLTGTADTIVITVRTNNLIPSGTVVTNTAYVIDSIGAKVLATAPVTILPAPKFELLKTVSRDTAREGDTLRYVLRYHNTGNSLLTHVAILDTLPAQVTVLSVSGGFSVTSGILSAAVDSLPMGKVDSIVIIATINANTFGGTVLRNTAHGTSDQAAPVVSTVITTIRSLAQLSLLKSASADSVRNGDTLHYTIRLANQGNVPLINVVMRDTLPALLGNFTVSPNAQLAGGIVTFSRDTVYPGHADTILVSGRVAENATGLIHIMNTAVATANSITPVQSTVTTVVKPLPGFVLDKTVSRTTALGGDPLQYVIHFGNTGNITLTHLVITDTLPAGFIPSSVSANAILSNRIVRLMRDTLKAGAMDSVVIDGMVAQGAIANTMIHNTAHGITDQTPDQRGDVSTMIQAAPAMTISKRVSSPEVSSFEPLSYVITIRNTGNQPLTNVTITDSVPALLLGLGVSSNATLSGHVVSYHRDTLNVGTSDSITITATTPAASVTPRTITNTAVVQSNEVGPEQSSASTVLSGVATLSITKTVNADTIRVGGDVQYMIVVRNTGTTPLTGVAMKDTVPSQLRGVSVSANASLAGSIVGFTKDSMAIGEADTILVNATLATDRPNKEHVKNTAYVQAVESPRRQAEATFVTKVVVEDKSCVIVVTSTPDLVIGNDSSAAVIRATVTDSLGNPKPDGTPVYMQTTLGRWSNNQPSIVHYTIGGVVIDSLRVLVSGNRIMHALAAVTASDSDVCFASDTVDVTFYPGAVSGRVVDRITNLTVPGAVITVYASDNTIVGADTTGEDGHYLIPVPKTDTYRITVKVKNNFGQDVTITTFVFIGVPGVGGLPPVPNRNAVEGTIFYYVSGVPIPVPNIGVVLIPVDSVGGLKPRSIHGGTAMDSTVTDSLGTYKFNDIPAGAYRVEIRHDKIDGQNTVVNLGNGEYVINTNLPVLLNPNMLFTKTGVSTALAIDTVAYTITMGNTGNLATTNTIIRDTLDARMIFVDATNGGVFDSASHSILWNLGRVDSGSVHAVNVRVRFSDTIKTALNLVNHATLSASEILDIPVQAPTRVLVPGKVKIWKNSNVHRASMGDTISYAIHVKNLSDISATNVEITDPLPAQVRFLSADTTISLSPDSVVVTIRVDSLVPQQQRDFIVKAIVRTDLGPGEYLYVNTAALVWHGGEGNSSQDTSSHADVRTLLPYITIQKQAIRKIVNIGDIAAYQIRVTNTSATSKAFGVKVNDRIPFGFTYVAGSSFRDTSKIGDPTGKRELLWKLIDTLKPKQTVTLTYRLMVGAGAVDGDGINEALAVANSPTASFLSTAKVQERVEIRRGVFSERGLILGKIFFDENENRYQDDGDKGVKGVELMMEDGTRITTGNDGKYSLPDVAPGDHVIRVRQFTLPKGSTLLLGYGEFAGEASSRFVKVPESGIARADFYLKHIAPPKPAAARLAQSVALTGVATAQRVAEPKNLIFIDDERPAPLKLQGSNFDVGKAVLHPEAFGMLKTMAEILKEYDDQTALVAGHTDSMPIHTSEFPSNKELSEARAMAVKNYLVKTEGIDASRIRTQGFGPDRPLASNSTKETRSINRRVEVYLGNDVERPKRMLSTVVFRIPLSYRGSVPLQKIEVTDLLDSTFHFVEGSAFLDGKAIRPKVDGQKLIWTVDSAVTSYNGTITYQTIVYHPTVNSMTATSVSTVRYMANGHEIKPATVATTTNTIAVAVRGKAINLVLSGVLFDVGKSTLRSNAVSAVQTAAELLKVNPGSTALVEGHTDSRPIHTPEFPSNIELSDARAKMVASLISEKFGIDAARMHSVGWGELRPIATNLTADGRQENRRVEIRITKKEYDDQGAKDGGVDSSIVIRTDVAPETSGENIDSSASGQPGDKFMVRLAVNLPHDDQTVSMILRDSLPTGLSILPGSVTRVSGIDSIWSNTNSLGAVCSLGDTAKVIVFMVECTPEFKASVQNLFTIERKRKDGTSLHDTAPAAIINLRKDQ